MNQWSVDRVYDLLVFILLLLLFVYSFSKVFKRCNVLCGSYEYCVFIPGVKQCWQIKILLFGYLKSVLYLWHYVDISKAVF